MGWLRSNIHVHGRKFSANELLQRATGGVLWCEELARLTRLQQKNLLFAAERLARYDLRLVAATAMDTAALTHQGWEDAQLKQIFDV